MEKQSNIDSLLTLNWAILWFLDQGQMALAEIPWKTGPGPLIEPWIEWAMIPGRI